jgi:hypothetical protein
VPKAARGGDALKSTDAMPKLSPEGLRAVADVAQRTGFSPDAVTSMLFAVIAGKGSMAQFSHPEFGGSGQWMPGGAIMLSDMFNNALKARVDALCGELSALVTRGPGLAAAGSFQSQSQGGAVPFGGGRSSLLLPEANWWPAELGAPESVGAQNAARYAYFPAARRLAVDLDGKVTVYDTQDHQISGFSQQQSGSGFFAFLSQYGTVDVGRLRKVSSGDAEPPPAAGPGTPSAAGSSAPAPAGSGAAPAGYGEILGTIEKLADLRAKGVLTEAEFTAKKAELLSRL